MALIQLPTGKYGQFVQSTWPHYVANNIPLNKCAANKTESQEKQKKIMRFFLFRSDHCLIVTKTIFTYGMDTD